MENNEIKMLDMMMNEDNTCPCRVRPWRRLDEEANDNGETLLWEVLFTCAVLLWMFLALLSDRVGADAVMLAALTAFMASQIITVQEGLAGFANEGLLTVIVLFVVAEGISKTGALDWYMGKLLGRPNTTASAQLRLMVPIAFVSAFLNNTPVVAVMIPIVQRWGKNIGISPQQLLVPLSFASILGGTCTLIGTSTNLVVLGLLQERYPNDSSVEIGLFDLGQFGVPIAIAGVAYILIASPFLLPGAMASNDNGSPLPTDNQDDILLGARVTPWSPAVGRSVKRSGLRDTGGIYLVSVNRAATGNVHRAVGQDFVMNEGDILYFTGLVESFGDFCEEHGLEVLTNEIQDSIHQNNQTIPEEARTPKTLGLGKEAIGTVSTPLPAVAEDDDDFELHDLPIQVGVTKESLIQADEKECARSISRMTDMIRGTERTEDDAAGIVPRRKRQALDGFKTTDPPKIVVTADSDLVVIGVNAIDRPGLLLDISKGLLRLHLSLRHTEASVVGPRSVSIWRCECIETQIPDLEEIWSVLNALLESENGIQAVKKRGLRVIRASVTKTSNLIGRTATEVDFRRTYKAAIVAIPKGKSKVGMSSVLFAAGDTLILQASDDSPLLQRPPDDFYKKLEQSKESTTQSRSSSVASFVNLLRSRSTASMTSLDKKDSTMAGSGADGAEQKDIEAQKEQNDTNSDDDNNDNNAVVSAYTGDGGEGFFMGDLDEVSGADFAESVQSGQDVTVTGMENMANTLSQEVAWGDLQVHFADENTDNKESATREFLTAMEVSRGSKLANRTVTQIGLDKLPGVFLVSIDRPATIQETGGKPKVTVISRTSSDAFSHGDGSEHESLRTSEPVFETISPDEPLKEGDVLWFAGSASAVGDLRKIPGLSSFEKDEVEKINEKIHDRRLVEAVVARRGPLVGRTVKEVRFRTRFGAAVIAVHRDGKRVHDHPGIVKLQAGDVLLLEAGPTFIKRSVDNDRSFALLAEVEDSAPPRLRFLIPALTITAAMLIVFTAGVTSLLICALVASILMVTLGILSEQEARNAVNWEVYITIAAAFGIGTALVNSGVAEGIAKFLVNIGEAVGIGDAGLLGAVYFATFLISNVVTNNAAAALLFPIALDAAEQTGTDRILMSYCLMLGASASFMSPFGYTTNLLIYGPGGYKYKDFLTIGTPMQVFLWVLSILFLSMTSTPWWVSWMVTSVILILVVASRSLPRLTAKGNSNKIQHQNENTTSG